MSVEIVSANGATPCVCMNLRCDAKRGGDCHGTYAAWVGWVEPETSARILARELEGWFYDGCTDVCGACRRSE